MTIIILTLEDEEGLSLSLENLEDLDLTLSNTGGG